MTGKPIPYWLYKLHGLNLEFKCEICGNYSYWGPRAFERHFQEWRHAYGMKCLGIPNTKPFHGITLIEDAYTLWAKLKAESGNGDFNPGGLSPLRALAVTRSPLRVSPLRARRCARAVTCLAVTRFGQPRFQPRSRGKGVIYSRVSPG